MFGRELRELFVPWRGLRAPVIAHHMCDEIPVPRLAGERHRQRAQEVTRRLVPSSLAAADANGMKLRGRAEKTPQYFVAETWLRARCRQTIKEEERETRNDRGLARIGIHRARGRAQPRGRRSCDRHPERESHSPFAQQAVFATRALAVLFKTGATFGADGMTERPGSPRVDAVRFLRNPCSEDVQIVDFAEQALDLSEAFVPLGRSLGQEDLNRIPEALQPDTERVPRYGSVRAHGAGVQTPEFLVTARAPSTERSSRSVRPGGHALIPSGPDGPMRADQTVERLAAPGVAAPLDDLSAP